MSFQRPEFLLALLLALLPAAFYLSRYVRSTRTVFPAAHYLFGGDKTPLSRLRGRQIMATVLRTAVICLAALAFAGPVLPEATTPIAASQGDETVLLFDTSTSMTVATSSGKSVWTTMASQAQSVIGSTEDNARIALVTCPRPQKELRWLSRDKALAALNNLQPSWSKCRPTPLLKALVPTLPVETRFHLFTDLALDDSEWNRLDSLLKGARNVTVHAPTTAPETNRAVAGIWPEPGGVGLLVETDSKEAAASDATISCPDYGASIPVPAIGPAGITLSIPVPPDLAPGICQVTLATDSLDHDNSAWFEAGSPDPTRILIVDGSPGHTVVASPGGFLTASLRAGEAFVHVMHLAQTEFSYDSLRLADLLVLVDPRPLPEYLEKGLIEFMARGGHVWLFAGNAMSEWKSDNLVLPGLQSRRCIALPEQPFHLIWTASDDSAVAAIKALPQASLRIWSHVRHTALTFLGRDVAVLARFDDGVPMVVRVPFARGELMLWSLIPAVDNGNFALHPAFPLTIQAALEEVAHPVAKVKVPPSCTVGRPCDLPDLIDGSDNAEAEGGINSTRVPLSAQHELICPVPGPYFLPGPEGRELAFVCRTRPADTVVSPTRRLPIQEQGIILPGSHQHPPLIPVAQLLLLAALALVFVELWMVSGRLKDRYEA